MTRRESDLPPAVAVHEAGFVQRREWMLHKVREDQYPLNLVVSFETEHFDALVFQRVIGLLVKKYEILRTTLRVTDGTLKQVVHQASGYPVEYRFFDFSAQKPGERAGLVKEIRIAQHNRPFDFECGPLFRILVFAESERQCEVDLVFHHVIFDAYSEVIFKRDAMQLWQSVSRGEEPEWQAGPVQYTTHTSSENELLDTAAGDAYREYWKAQLPPALPRLGIIDRQRWDAYYQSHAAKVAGTREKILRLPCSDQRFLASVVRRLEHRPAGSLDYLYAGSTFASLAAFRTTSNSSLLSLFIAGFLVALHKLSGQEVFGFDIPASRRTDGDYRHMIGWLTAGGICFFDMQENTSPGAFLDYIDKQLFLLSKYCTYPFEAAADEGPVPVGSTVPVFFTLGEVNHDQDTGGAAAGIVRHAPAGGNCYQNLDVNVWVYTNSCSVRIGYDNALLLPGVIESVMREQELALNDILQSVLRAGRVVLI